MAVLTVNLKDRSYDIQIERGLMSNIGERIKKVYHGIKIAVVTDDNLKKLYGEALLKKLKEEGFCPNIISLPPGEKSKSLEALEEIYEKLVDFNITRKDLILAFGGGVIGDLAGFAASTYLRGIPFMQIPTSLLAQIDSSIGGKVAVNLMKGKNLVGSFYQPRAVFIDPDVLSTLDETFFKDGLGEVIKYGAILDEELFYDLMKYSSERELLNNIDHIIYRCCSIKKSLVEKDEMDFKDRMLLNFGHTLGHAIEKYFNYEKYSHGFGVSIGMYNITKKSEDMGDTEAGTSEAIKDILHKYDLPYALPEMNKDALMNTMLSDKKNIQGRLNLVLLEKIGRAFIKPVEISKVKDYIL